MQHTTGSWAMTAQQRQHLVVTATTVNDQRQIELIGQLDLSLEPGQLLSQWRLDGAIQSALPHRHQPGRALPQQLRQSLQRRLGLIADKPGVQPQGIRQPGDFIVQRGQLRPVGRWRWPHRSWPGIHRRADLRRAIADGAAQYRGVAALSAPVSGGHAPAHPPGERAHWHANAAGTYSISGSTSSQDAHFTTPCSLSRA